jgi:hypothetical protein
MNFITAIPPASHSSSLKLAFVLALSLSLGACSSLSAPSAETMSKLPIVSYPNTPPSSDFIYKIPAGVPVTIQTVVRGNALASPAQQSLAVSLPRDVFVHKRWISEDGKTWQPAQDVFDIRLQLSLPSDEFPRPGEILLTVDRKIAR